MIDPLKDIDGNISAWLYDQEREKELEYETEEESSVEEV